MSVFVAFVSACLVAVWFWRATRPQKVPVLAFQPLSSWSLPTPTVHRWQDTDGDDEEMPE